MSLNHKVKNLILGPGNVDSPRALQDHLFMTENACCKAKMGWYSVAWVIQLCRRFSIYMNICVLLEVGINIY